MFVYFVILLFAISQVVCDDGTHPKVTSSSGVFKGSFMNTRKGRQFLSFRGIRYAEPPVDRLRFQPPVPIHHYRDEVDASEEGPACPLPVPDTYFISEDCLRLNVYTPTTRRNASLPVIVFIHAGGFYSMTGRSDVAGPHYLLDRDVVLVTMNYRIGSLGFISTGDQHAPGNNGMKDQVAALQWVQRNIRSFGGDPRSVTLTGCSAGSISVMLHMISPMSKGLFHRGIGMSGSPVSGKAPTPDNLMDLAVKQAQLLNCPYHSGKAIIDCLKTKHWRDIGNSLTGFFNYAFDPVGLWLPVVERDFGQQRFLAIQPDDAIRQNKMHAVPFIISRTTQEFYWFGLSIVKNETLRKRMNENWEEMATISFLLPKNEQTKHATERLRQVYLQDRPLEDDQQSADGLGGLYADSIMGYPIDTMANMMAIHSPKPVWYYLFNYVGEHSHYEDPVTKKPIGAMHHDDLIYLFSLSYAFPTITPDSPDSAMVDKMTAIWYNFARYSDPNPRCDTPEVASLSWPAMTPTDRKYERIDKQFTTEDHMFADRYRVWNELYPARY